MCEAELYLLGCARACLVNVVASRENTPREIEPSIRRYTTVNGIVRLTYVQPVYSIELSFRPSSVPLQQPGLAGRTLRMS